jgi:hypothetical protein
MSEDFDRGTLRTVAAPNTNGAWTDLGSDDNEHELVTDGGEEIEDDDTIVYATMTVDGSGDMDADRLNELFPNADHVEAHHRVTGDYLVETGDDPSAFVCPECGEGTHSKRDIDGTPYYRHYDNKECARDVRDALEQKREERRKANRKPAWQQALGFAIGVVLSVGVMAVVLRVMPQSEMTINGDSVMVPPSDPSLYAGLGVVLMVAFIIALGLQYLPGAVISRGGRL